MGHCWKPETAPTGGDLFHVRKSRVPIGHSYVPHEGAQAKLRRLRQRTRGLQPSVDQDFRLNVWLKTAPGIANGSVNSDYARMFVLSHALAKSEDTGLPFPDVLDSVLDTLEREQSNAIIQELTR
jgi:hypothetical protein